MERSPSFIFNGLTDTGIDEVPNGKEVVVMDDGNGKIKKVFKIDNTGLDSSSTISDFLIKSISIILIIPQLMASLQIPEILKLT